MERTHILSSVDDTSSCVDVSLPSVDVHSLTSVRVLHAPVARLPVPSVQMHVMDKSKLMEALQRLPISFGMAMGVRAKCQKVAQR